MQNRFDSRKLNVGSFAVTSTQREVFLEIHLVIATNITGAVHEVLELGKFIEIDIGVFSWSPNCHDAVEPVKSALVGSSYVITRATLKRVCFAALPRIALT
jgi:hypothetical protein